MDLHVEASSEAFGLLLQELGIAGDKYQVRALRG
jgi:hypothetical protein